MMNYEKSIYLKPGTPLPWPHTLTTYNEYMEKRGQPHLKWKQFVEISTKMNTQDDESNETLTRKVWMTKEGELVSPQSSIVIDPKGLLIKPQWGGE